MDDNLNEQDKKNNLAILLNINRAIGFNKAITYLIIFISGCTVFLIWSIVFSANISPFIQFTSLITFSLVLMYLNFHYNKRLLDRVKIYKKVLKRLDIDDVCI